MSGKLYFSFDYRRQTGLRNWYVEDTEGLDLHRKDWNWWNDFYTQNGTRMDEYRNCISHWFVYIGFMDRRWKRNRNHGEMYSVSLTYNARFPSLDNVGYGLLWNVDRSVQDHRNGYFGRYSLYLHPLDGTLLACCSAVRSHRHIAGNAGSQNEHTPWLMHDRVWIVVGKGMCIR